LVLDRRLANLGSLRPPKAKLEMTAPLKPSGNLTATKLMMIATISLSLVASCSVGLQHIMLPNFDRGNPQPSSEAPSPFEASPPPPPQQQLSDADAQEAFLELVKRRASIQTPLVL